MEMAHEGPAAESGTAKRYSAGERDQRPWGTWEVLATGPGYTLKRIAVNPGHRLSRQYHNHRCEHWIIVAGKAEVARSTRFPALCARAPTFTFRSRLVTGPTNVLAASRWYPSRCRWVRSSTKWTSCERWMPYSRAEALEMMPRPAYPAHSRPQQRSQRKRREPAT